MDGAGSFSPRPGSEAGTGTDAVPAASGSWLASPPRTRWARWTAPGVTLPVVVAVLAITLAVVLVDRGEQGPGVGEAIVEVSGRAQVQRAGHTRAEAVTGRTRLEPGDRFDLRTGIARFELADGLRYEGMGHSSDAAGTSLVMGFEPVLRSGRLLVEAASGAASIRAGSARVRVSPRSTARLSRSYAVRLGAYRGSAELSWAGRARKVGAFRSAEGAGPGEVGPARPLAYDADDRWDRRFLGDAIYLDGQLAPLVKGIEASGIAAPALVDAIRRQLPRSPSAAVVARLIGGAPRRVDVGIGLAVVGAGPAGTSTVAGTGPWLTVARAWRGAWWPWSSGPTRVRSLRSSPGRSTGMGWLPSPGWAEIATPPSPLLPALPPRSPRRV